MSLLTKSKYLKSLRCHRLLWFADKNKLSQASLFEQYHIDQDT